MKKLGRKGKELKAEKQSYARVSKRQHGVLIQPGESLRDSQCGGNTPTKTVNCISQCLFQQFNSLSLDTDEQEPFTTVKHVAKCIKSVSHRCSSMYSQPIIVTSLQNISWPDRGMG